MADAAYAELYAQSRRAGNAGRHPARTGSCHAGITHFIISMRRRRSAFSNALRRTLQITINKSIIHLIFPKSKNQPRGPTPPMQAMF
uniref:hypothetical protein n=1 Tax=Burkholderia diffusa TaxID=488732 RepID=UPI001CC351B8|nr:hypothetical protein [Burkholderia diffusa]